MNDRSFNLRTYQGQARLLLLFAAHPDDTGFLTQVNMLTDSEQALAERDVVIAELHQEAESHVAGRPIAADAVQDLYRQFEVPPEAFMLILVGKDGTEKRREAAPVKVEALLAAIDGMPMRQREAEAPSEDGS